MRKLTLSANGFSPWLICLLTLLSAAGCSPPGNEEAAQSEKELTPFSADELLSKMIDAYQTADHYNDTAELHVKYTDNGQIKEVSSPLSVAFERPGKLAVNAYQVKIASDGEKIRTLVEDPVTKNLDGQFAQAPAPKAFTWPTPQFDPVAMRVMQAGGAGMPIQLELLLSGNPLESMFAKTATRTKVDNYQQKGYAGIEVVQVETTGGVFKFHIEISSFELVWLELPPQSLDNELTSNPAVDVREAYINFSSSQFRSAKTDRFTLKPSADAAVVSHLQLPPDGLPSELLGKTPAEFSFVTLDDERVKQEDLKGKTTALLWFSNDEVSQPNIKRFNEVARAFSSDKDVAFYAICTEPTVNSHNDVRKFASRWKVEPVVLRDIEHDGKEPAGKTAFKVPAIPCCVVIDKKGVVQVFEPGDFATMETRLPTLVEDINDGEQLAAAKRKLVAQEKAAYQAHLKGEVESLLLETPELIVASASEPAEVSVKQLWKNDGLTSPGAVAVLEGKTQRIFVLDDAASIVELDTAGKSLQTIKLPLPGDAAVDQMRVAAMGDKAIFAVFKTMGESVYLVDESGKLLTSYPESKQKHGGIRVAELADLDDEGGPELYVGFWAGLGVHQVDMTGKRTGANRQAGSVLSLSTTPPNEFDWRQLLSTDERGVILPLNQFMNADPAIRVPGYLVHELHASNFPLLRLRNYMALSYLGQLKIRVAALSDKYEPLWSFQLPMQVRPPVIASGRLLNDATNHWVMAWPDGNINLLSADASFNDFYRFGEEITGMALLPKEDKRSFPLLVSTPSGVSAWQVSRKATGAATLPGGSKVERTGKDERGAAPRR